MTFVEASIRRLSPQQRGKLKRRLVNSAKGWGWDARSGSPEHPDSVKAAGNAKRFTAMLGRFSALTAGLEVR